MDFFFYRMYQTGKSYWEVRTIVKRIGRMVHKRNLKQTKSRYTEEVNNIPVDVEPMEILFDTFDVPIPRKASRAKIQKRQREKERIQRESTLTRKGKDMDFVQNKFKKEGVIYPTAEH